MEKWTDLLDEGGGDLGLVELLGDLVDLELFSLTVDDGLDLLLLYRVDVLAVHLISIMITY